MDDPKEPLTASQAISNIDPAVLTALVQAIGGVLQPQAPDKAGPAVADQAKAADMAAGVSPPLVAEAGPSLSAQQIGTELGDALIPLAAPILRRSMHRLASRKFWIVVGTLAGLLSQNAMGLDLHPAGQLSIAALAAIWIVVQGTIDGKQSGGGNGQG